MLFVTIVAIMSLCVNDAVFTLYLMTYGAYEINPFMAYLLNFGPSAFIIPKCGITMISTFALFMFRDVVVRRLNLSTGAILYGIAWICAAVVAWEIFLVYNFT